MDSEDGLVSERPASLTFESDFLLGQEIEFSDPDNDGKIIGLEKFSGELEILSPANHIMWVATPEYIIVISDFH